MLEVGVGECAGDQIQERADVDLRVVDITGRSASEPVGSDGRLVPADNELRAIDQQYPQPLIATVRIASRLQMALLECLLDQGNGHFGAGPAVGLFAGRTGGAPWEAARQPELLKKSAGALLKTRMGIGQEREEHDWQGQVALTSKRPFFRPTRREVAWEKKLWNRSRSVLMRLPPSGESGP